MMIIPLRVDGVVIHLLYILSPILSFQCSTWLFPRYLVPRIKLHLLTGQFDSDRRVFVHRSISKNFRPMRRPTVGVVHYPF